MAYNYDALYAQTPNALGDPTKVFVDFFQTFDKKNARVLDIGCGQGRDALFIARLGHHVVGVDLSPRGIQDMKTIAGTEGLSLIGVVSDISEYQPTGQYDVVVIDRTLHMLQVKLRLAALARILGCVKPSGWVLIEDEKSNIAGFKHVIAADAAHWETAKETRGTLFIRRYPTVTSCQSVPR